MEGGLQAAILWKKAVAQTKMGQILMGWTAQKENVSICFCKVNKKHCSMT